MAMATMTSAPPPTTSAPPPTTSAPPPITSAPPPPTSAPPPSPPPQHKRKLDTLDLGNSLFTRPVKAQKVYYGVHIHQLLADAQAEESIPKAARTIRPAPTSPAEPATSKRATLLWTEKYRARKFTDLIGDERTHRHVMHWLKRWDEIVFPGSRRPKPKTAAAGEDEKPHRKLLMLTGPPGLGKTTLAHVCAKQAGYEVQEINASDERSSAVVKGRIRDMVGTENVKKMDSGTAEGKGKKAAKPVCVIVDEVDGVVGGSGAGGEGGFVKALIDLVMLDQKNTPLALLSQAPAKKKKKGERFRLLRPIILVCNDVYHPSLRPLQQSLLAEVVHVRKPPVQSLVTRLQQVFEKEGVPCDSGGVRRLCEAAWGVSNRKEDRRAAGAGEGDMRGIMVVGEWVAGKLRASSNDERLTRKWVEDNILTDLAHGGGGARGLGRGSPKDIVERVFQEGAGLPRQAAAMATPPQTTGNDGVQGVAEGVRRTATSCLRELIDTLGETDRIMTACFSTYPERDFQDDTMLSKPDSAYEWLNFHDQLSSAVFTSSEWELAPYLSTPILAFHHLFASPTRAQYQAPLNAEDSHDTTPSHPFSGPSAARTAHELQKSNESHLQTLQSNFSLDLLRSFRSHADIATDLQPYLLRMLTPNVNPVVIGGSGKDKGTASVRKASEQTLIKRAVNAMGASGVRFDRVRLEARPEQRFGTANEWVYRMEPPIDMLCTFETAGTGPGAAGGQTTRYAVRQVLEQEWKREELRLAEKARMARSGVANATAVPAAAAAASMESRRHGVDDADAARPKPARDFFGRAVVAPVSGRETELQKRRREDKEKKGLRVWVTFHEGFSNAVRKPITLQEFMHGL